MTMKSRFVLFILLAASITACNESENHGPPVVTSISPSSGPFDTEVTITGNHFVAQLDANGVAINGKIAEIISATETQIVFKVPKRAGTGSVFVSTAQGTTEGPEFDFVYTTTVSTLSGSTQGYLDGAHDVAKFHDPSGIEISPDGNLMVGDRLNHKLRIVTMTGTASTYSGDDAGSTDGNISIATYNMPNEVAYDKNGNLYLTDLVNNKIRIITTDGTVSTFAGNGSPGFVNGPGASAQFAVPVGVVVDNNLNVFVTEFDNHTIRKISPTGNVSTFAGNGSPGFVNSTGTDARFNMPTGIDVDSEGNLYVADLFNHRIRKISPSAVVTTVAGSGTQGFEDGSALAATFNGPRGVAVDAEGNIYVADTGNSAIRLVTYFGTVVTVAGTGVQGSDNGSGLSASFNLPYSLDVDDAGTIYVADKYNSLIRKVVVE